MCGIHKDAKKAENVPAKCAKQTAAPSADRWQSFIGRPLPPPWAAWASTGFASGPEALRSKVQRIDKLTTLQRGCRKGRPAPSYLIRSGGVYAARSGCKPLPLSCSGRALRAQEHDVPFAARLRNSLAAKDRRQHVVDGLKPCAARFPCTFPRPRLRRRGNVSWRQRPAKPAFFDKLRKGLAAPSCIPAEVCAICRYADGRSRRPFCAPGNPMSAGRGPLACGFDRPRMGKPECPLS